MSKKDELGSLIFCLTKSEKRYFKLYAARHSKKENNYLALFEAVEKMGEYDSKKIEKKFTGTKLGSNLRVIKHQLYHLILKSMSAFHSSTTNSAELREQLSQIEFLVQKGLYAQTIKLLLKSKENAINSELFIPLLQIISIQKDLIYKNTDIKTFEQSMKTLQEEECLVMDQLNNYTIYSGLIFNIFKAYSKEGIARDEEQFKTGKSVLENSLLKDEKQALSKRGLDMFYFLKGACLLYTGEIKEAYIFTSKRLTHLEKNRFIVEEDPYGFIETLRQHTYVCTGLRKYKEAQSAIDQINDLPNSVRADERLGIQLRVVGVSFPLQLNLYKDKKDFSQASILANNVSESLERFDKMLNQYEVIPMIYGVSVVLCGDGKYKEALKWINLLLNDFKNAMRQDIYAFAKILEIIIHYELNNEELIEFITVSTKRHLSSRKKLFKIEKVFLDNMMKICIELDGQKRKNLFMNFHSELLETLKDQNQKRALQYFDLLSWVKNKIA
jgi:hypothetical protein